MGERKRTSSKTAKGKQSAPQKTLLDHFTRKKTQDNVVDNSSGGETKEQEPVEEPVSEIVESPQSLPLSLPQPIVEEQDTEEGLPHTNTQGARTPISISPSSSSAPSAPLDGDIQAIDEASSPSNGLESPAPSVTDLRTPPRISSPTPPPPSSDDIIEILDELPAPVSTQVSVPTSLKVPSNSGSMSRTTSFDGGTRHDPIVLDTHTPIKPKGKVTRPSPLKPAYSIFAPRRPQAASPSKPGRSSKASKSSVEAPFPDSTSQHVRGPQTPLSGSPVPRRRRESPRKSDINHSTESSSWSQGLSSILTPPPDCTCPKRRLFALPNNSISDRVAHLNGIPLSHKIQPVIARLIDASTTPDMTAPAPSPFEQRLWTDKWRPTRAIDVLGNEENALHLRDWLHALELESKGIVPSSDPQATDSKPKGNGKGKAKEDARGTKRQRVVRAVAKKRGRKRQRIDSEDEDSWIVDDEFSDDEDIPTYGDDDDDFLAPIQPQPPTDPSSLGQRSQNPPPRTFHTLTNTILLTGPPGTGKTASVYACADELGWEVFEVYPGIGKRNGANLDNLVGEVGKNHLVRKTQPRGGDIGGFRERDAFSALLKGRRAKDRDVSDAHESAEVEVEVEEGRASSTDFGFVSRSSDSNESTPSVRQSLILLEEVDILFKDDANFWPSVINFIKDCRRPVICTCNDPSLIPLADLPLQAILGYEPCPTPEAASYLQSLCCAEGYLVERDVLADLYEPKNELGHHEFIGGPDVLAGHGVPDLRRTINHLQSHCPNNNDGDKSSGSHLCGDIDDDRGDGDWRPGRSSLDLSPNSNSNNSIGPAEWCLADFASFVDSHLLRNSVDTPESLLSSDIKSSADDELGHTILFDSRAEASFTARHVFGQDDRDGVIASTAIRLSRGALEGEIPRYPAARSLFRARVHHREILRMLGNNGTVLERQILHKPEFELEYLPWIRQMVAADDDLEKVVDRPSQKRTTRNSQRSYVRTVKLNGEERNELGKSALPETS